MGQRAFAVLGLAAFLLLAGSAGAAAPTEVRLGTTGTLPADVVGVAVDLSGTVGAAISAGSATNLGATEEEIFVYDLKPGAEGLRFSQAVDTSLLSASKGLAHVALAAGTATTPGAVVAVSSPNASPTKVFTYNVVRQDRLSPANGFQFPATIRALGLDTEGARFIVQHENGVHIVPVGATQVPPAFLVPATGESITAIAWAPDLSFVAVGISSPSTHRVELVRTGTSPVTSSSTHDTSVRAIAFSPDAVGFAVAQGTSVWLYTINDADKIETASDGAGKGRWQHGMGQPVTHVSVAKTLAGHTVAAGGGSGGVQVYTVADWADGSDVLTITRIWNTPASVSGATRSLVLTRDGQSLYVRSNGVSMFHGSQFVQGPPPAPLWTLAGDHADLAAARDGEVFMTGVGQNVHVFRHAHAASMAAPSAQTVDPGTRVPLRFTLTNTGSTFDAFDVVGKDLSVGWDVAVAPAHVDTLPESPRTVHVNVTLPAGAAPGAATGRLSVMRGANEVASTPLPLTVREKAAAALHVPTGPRAVEAGREAIVPIGIENRGNVAVDVVLRATASVAWPMRVSGADLPHELTVPVGANETVEVRVAVRDTATSGSRNPVTFRVERAGGGGLLASDTLVLVVSPDWQPPEIAGLPTTALRADAGEDADVTLTLKNVGNTQDTFRLTARSRASDPEKLWQTTLSGPKLRDGAVTLEAGESTQVTVTVKVPRGAVEDETAIITILARSDGADDDAESSFTVRSTGTGGNGAPLPAFVVPAALIAAALVARRRWAR